MPQVQVYTHYMAAHSLLTPEQWREARTAVETGIPSKEVAGMFGIDLFTLLKRAQRENWLTQTAREKALESHRAKVSALSPKDNQLSIQRPKTPSALEIYGKTAAELGEQSRLRLLQLGAKALGKKNLENLPVDDWSTVETIAKVIGKAAGWDKAETAVQVNLWGDYGGQVCRASGGELEAEIVSQDEGEDWC